jgi:hypothetical protein
MPLYEMMSAMNGQDETRRDETRCDVMSATAYRGDDELERD